MFAFLGLYRFAIYAAAIAAFIGLIYYEKSAWESRIEERAIAPYKVAIEHSKQEAREKLAAETERVKATERERDGRIAGLVKDNENERAKSADFNKRLAAAGRLRDQDGGSRSSGCSTTSRETGNAGTVAGTGSGEGLELSSSLTTLLKDLIRDTDALISHDRLCMAYAREVSR